MDTDLIALDGIKSSQKTDRPAPIYRHRMLKRPTILARVVKGSCIRHTIPIHLIYQDLKYRCQFVDSGDENQIVHGLDSISSIIIPPIPFSRRARATQLCRRTGVHIFVSVSLSLPSTHFPSQAHSHPFISLVESVRHFTRNVPSKHDRRERVHSFDFYYLSREKLSESFNWANKPLFMTR